MYSRVHLARKYIQYYLTASNGKGHGTHSPFIFDFIKNVLNDNRHFYPYDNIESLRDQLLNDKSLMDIDDFGAGSTVESKKQRSVSSIARNAAKSTRLSQFLFRIVHYYQPRVIIELGTSLGISSAYMASAAPEAKLITIEGSPSVAIAARNHHNFLNLKNIEVMTGKFEDVLPRILEHVNGVDLAFVDGNHRYEPTKFYFEQLLTKASSQSIFIFDDIHWSKEMEDAWRMVKAHKAVTASIDLFFLGIVLFSSAFKSKRDFTIRF